MSDQDNYWNRFSQGRVTRRRALVATSGAAAAAAFLAACGGSSSSGGNKSSEKPAATDSSRTGKLDAATAGKRGGKLIWQGYGDPGAGLELVKVRNAGVHQLASFTHDALLEFVSGIQGYDGMDFGVQPNAGAGAAGDFAGQADLHIQAAPGQVPQRPRHGLLRRQILHRSLRHRLRLGLQGRLALARQV